MSDAELAIFTACSRPVSLAGGSAFFENGMCYATALLLTHIAIVVLIITIFFRWH
jgi:hypothetical protein